ncbi:g2606 [Coccomyxa viridis]|uniref:G2606 protein n=1 Tax=Coccomyxa viridis TaxID=1274662 RepID=A0ABP1FKT7_9CHLO
MAELMTHTRHAVPGLCSKQTVGWPRAPQPITARRLHRERLLSCRAASTSNSSGNQSKEAGSSAEAFSKAAGRRIKQTFTVVEDGVKRAASGVNSRFDVSGKASRAAHGVKEQAEAVEYKLGLKRKLRIFAEDTQRRLPKWRKQYAAFSKTTAGQAAFFAGLFVLCYTGLLFRLLNLLFILWWLAPLVILPLLNAASRQASAQARESQAKRQARQNPFFSAFAQAQQQQQRQRQQQQRGARSPGFGAGGPGSGAGRAGFGSRGASDEGPVIDVEYSTVDED